MHDDDEKKTIAFILAAPGWYLSLVIEGNGGQPDCLSDHPVVGWEIERLDGPYHPSLKRPKWDRVVSQFANPITIDDVSDCSNDKVIRDPLGKYYGVDFGERFDTADEVIKYFAERRLETYSAKAQSKA